MKTDGYFISNEDLNELEEIVMRLGHFLAIVYEQKIETPDDDEPSSWNRLPSETIFF